MKRAIIKNEDKFRLIDSSVPQNSIKCSVDSAKTLEEALEKAQETILQRLNTKIQGGEQRLSMLKEKQTEVTKDFYGDKNDSNG